MIDQSELREHIAHLERVRAGMLDDVRSVVERGAVNIKKDWAQRWSGHAKFPALPRAVTYDMSWGVGTVTGEVGPDKSKPQGALGNLIEFGSVNNAPIPGGAPALQAELPRFESALGDLGVRLLER